MGARMRRYTNENKEMSKEGRDVEGREEERNESYGLGLVSWDYHSLFP